MRPILQPGNSVAATWRARLDEHLGNYTLEGMRLRSSLLLGASHGVYGVTHLAALTRLLQRSAIPTVTSTRCWKRSWIGSTTRNGRARWWCA
jgi:hypothetical protein